MKTKLLTCFLIAIALTLKAQTSKTNNISGTITSVPSSGAHLEKVFEFLASDFTSCTGLIEVELSLQLNLGSGASCTNGTAYGVHEDLNVRLISPIGTTVDLVQDRWGYWTGNATQQPSFNGFTAVNATVNFDDDNTTNIESLIDWAAGNFAPHNPLSAFDGQNPVGTWRLQVSDGNGQFAPTDFICYVTSTLTVTCGATLGDLDLYSLEKNIKISQNPISDSVEISLGKKHENINIEVYNVFGQAILNRTFNNTEDISFNIKDIAGVYFVKIAAENTKSTVLKVIKK